jgi:hypothetical protein
MGEGLSCFAYFSKKKGYFGNLCNGASNKSKKILK